MYVYIYICIYTHMYIYVCIYICIHMHISGRPARSGSAWQAVSALARSGILSLQVAFLCTLRHTQTHTHKHTHTNTLSQTRTDHERTPAATYTNFLPYISPSRLSNYSLMHLECHFSNLHNLNRLSTSLLPCSAENHQLG